MIVRTVAAIAILIVLAGWREAPPPPYHPYYVVAPVPVALLVGPGSGYGLLATVPANVRLPIVLCEYRTGWCKVRYGRFDGWVYDPLRRWPADPYSSIFGH